MKRLLLIISALLVVASGAWADGLKVSTTESASAEYQYKIFCRNANTYYLGNTTNATNSGADYGLFAFFAADPSDGYDNGYYIYSIFEGKWVTYEALESYTGGKNKISLTLEKPVVPWNITADNSDNMYYDIRAFQTDKTVATMSWNWHGGAGQNTANTMGFYDYTDGNSGWGIVLAGGSGSPVADRKVVALYNVPSYDSEEALYALYNSDGTPKVYNETSGKTPQYFVLLQNGLDSQGEALYKLQKAESDGKYLHYQDFSETPYNYTFLNTSSHFYSKYTYTSGTAAVSPYYNLFRVWPNSTDNSSRPYSNQVSQCNNAVVNMYSGGYSTISAPLDVKGNWNGRWKVVTLSGYTAWQVVITGASGSITYTGSDLLSGATTLQSNNGIFVLNATPTANDFTPTFVDGYLSDPAITIDSDRKLIKVAYTGYSDGYNTIVTTLENAPEGVGYPTMAARTKMQAAIDAFDASAKATANLTTLNNAYDTFLTSVALPELGKVYTIQNYIKSSSTTTYLKNVDGTLTIGTDADGTALNNLWIVRKSGTNNVVLQSAADFSKYIVYTSFTLATTGSDWSLSQGTEWPYISMYNSSLGGGRYVACNGSNQFGTAGDGGYYGRDRTQSSSAGGWSTDFKFVENTDYALYKVKIIYPQGSSPTVTYNETAYSNGDEFLAATGLTTASLSVSEVAGYTHTISIDDDIIYVTYNMTLNQTYADTWNFDTYPWAVLQEVPATLPTDRTYRYNTKRLHITTTCNSTVAVEFAYSSGSYRIDVAGVDLINPSTGEVVKTDYHDGYSGNEQSNREYVITNVAPGDYILRYITYSQSTSSAGNISIKITPATGYYRIKNNGTNNYLAYGTPYASSLSDPRPVGLIATATSNDAASVIKLTGSNGTYKLSVQGLNIQSQTTGSTAFPGSEETGVDFVFNISSPGVVSITNAASRVDANKDGSLHEATDGWTVHGVVNWSASADNSKWVVEDATSVTLSLNDGGDGYYYATMYMPFDVTISSGTTAYTLTVRGNYAIASEVEDNEVPAGTAVLLRGSSSSCTATINTGSAFNGGEPLDDNDLTGTYVDITGDRTTGEYIFGLVDDKVGFYVRKSGKKIGANKGYLLLGSDVSVKGFAIQWDFEDAIKDMDNTQQSNNNSGIYNLAGQRVKNAQKGIYIVNSKKVLVK